MRLVAGLLGGILVVGAFTGSAAWYRQRQINAGYLAFKKKDYGASFADLRPFDGWHSPQAETVLGDLYRAGNGVPQDETKADAWYQKAADHGVAAAQFYLGRSYLTADGVEQNYRKAFALLQKASDQGLPGARYAVGEMYEHGWGVAKNNGRALFFFKDASARGYSVAQAKLGYLYSVGEGVPQDYKQANKYLTMAANQGNADAEDSLGINYLAGRGLLKDRTKAASLFRQAAEQDSGAALFDLAQLYYRGKGVPRSMVLSYAYLNLAVAKDYPGTKQFRHKIALLMTPEQITDAQSLSGEWTKGAPLPTRVSYEDWAPDFLFSSATPVKTIAATRIWFSRQFTSRGRKMYAVFLVTKGGEDHAASAHISVVTFDESVGPTHYNFAEAQRNFARSGSFGDVAPPENPNAPFTSQEQVATQDFQVGKRRYAVLVPDGFSQMGETLQSDDVYMFSGGGWTDSGLFLTGDSTMGNCVAGQSVYGAGSCYAWTGTVEMVPPKEGAWPEFVVNRHGTVQNAQGQTIKAGSRIYYYNGKKYVARR